MITPISDLLSIMDIYRADGLTVVATNGCFDIIHAGHVRYLTQAKALGDVLVVGLNDDASVRRIKGPSRPVNSAQDRAAVLAALRPVDHVVLFGEDTAEYFVDTLAPDIYVKGGDYQDADLPEATIVRRKGGMVQILEHVPGRSTTELIRKIS